MPADDAAAKQSLAGRRVVITRAAEQAGGLADVLRGLGAEPLFLPLVAFEAMGEAPELDAAIGRLAEYDWVFLTSQNALQFLQERCAARGVDFAALSANQVKVAAVGPATAEFAARLGVRVRHVAGAYRGEGLAAGLAAEIRGKSILLPRSDRAGEALPATLERSGARVTQVVAYRTRLSAALPGPVWDMILRGAADVITFASPSAFHSFFEEWQNAGRLSPPDAILAAIGPTTATAIREAGWNCAIVAAQSTAQGLAAAITAHFRGNT